MKHSILFVILLSLTGCVPEGLMGTWSTTQEYDKKFTNVLVLGMIENVTTRSGIEDDLVYAARKNGMSATNGISMFPPELGKPFEDVERFKGRLRDKGFDGIVTVALVDVKAARYTPPSAKYEPLVYYDRFRNYYAQTYDLVYRPGYFSPYSIYFLETNFYELKGGTLVWSGRSYAMDGADVEAYSPTYAKGLFRELILVGVIAK
jgi:hypothetical protein